MVVPRPFSPLVVLLLTAASLAGCLADDGGDFERQTRALEEARLAELETHYNRSSGPLLGLEDFPVDADWVALDLVVTEPVEALGVTLNGLPKDDEMLGLLDERACVEVVYDGLGGWIGFMGEGHTLDTHALALPGPDGELPSGDRSSPNHWFFEDPEPLVDHRIVIAVDDADAWRTRGHAFSIDVRDGTEVHWRVASHGGATCNLHFADFDSGGQGARLWGAGAAVDLYDAWYLAHGGLVTVAFRADVKYHIYLAYADRYALAEWDSDTSVADAAAGIAVVGEGKYGIFAQVLAGARDTYLHSFVVDGYQSPA